jgi:hypothetical protein
MLLASASLGSDARPDPGNGGKDEQDSAADDIEVEALVVRSAVQEAAIAGVRRPDRATRPRGSATADFDNACHALVGMEDTYVGEGAGPRKG